ncbi:Protein of unknown function [Pyronema omphalodes CBS 100304]|uniref:Uncharacterized protein n=1 Tax=Pyronema omphalodes (strain CBS 100304) TaxID=1076935 RepID=U4LLB2_PYROM|nr:Protein of unknown function [Pyronema omphalodes CBS 100304]
MMSSGGLIGREFRACQIVWLGHLLMLMVRSSWQGVGMRRSAVLQL